MTSALARRSLAVAAALTMVVMSVADRALASDAPRPPVVAPGQPSTTTPALQPARPYWPELTPQQREALAPLVSDWEHIDGQTKRKWVEIARRYPKMKPEEQSRSQQRMREWALLTPEQRRVARDSYERVRAMPPQQRADMLRRYQELPAERREALTQEGVATRALVVPKATTAPTAAAVTRRLQIKEGARDKPVIAAQKSASPVAGPPASVARPNTAPVATTPASVAVPTPVVPSTAGPGGSAQPAAAPAGPAPTPPASPTAPVFGS